MDYVIGEILLCLLAAAIIFTVIGWLLHGRFGQDKLRVLQATKNHEIELLQGKLETAGRARTEAASALEKAIGHLKNSEASLASTTQALTDAKSKHEADATALKARIAALEPLTAAVSERDGRIEAWQRRFEGLVAEKDNVLSAAWSELAEHKTKLGALGLTLAAAVAEKDSLAARVDEHQKAVSGAQAAVSELQTKLADHEQARQTAETQKDELIAELQAKVDGHQEALEGAFQKASSEKDGLVADLRARLSEADDKQVHQVAKVEELTAQLRERDEQLKSFDQRMRGATAEKDTVISQLRTEVLQRDALIEQLHKQLASVPVAATAGQEPSAELEEAQRQIHAMQAAGTSMKTALEGKDAEIAGLAAKLESMKTDEGRASMLESQVIDVTGRHAAAKAELDNWASKYAELESRLHQLESEHGAATRTVAEKQDELDKSRAEVASLDTRTMTAMDQLKARVAELEKALDAEIPQEAQLRAAIASKDSELAELRAQIGHRDEQLAGAAMLQDQVIDVTGRHAAAKGELNDAGNRVEELESRLRAQADELEAATRTIADKQIELDKTRAEVAELDSKFVAVTSAAPHEDVAVLKETIASLEKELEGLRAAHPAEPLGSEKDERIQMLESQILDVTGRHAAAKGELDSFGNRVEELESQLRAQADELAAATRTVADKQIELDKTRAEVAELDSKFVAVTSAAPNEDVAALKETIASLEKELSGARAAQLSESVGLEPVPTEKDERIHMLESQILDVTGRHAAAKGELEDWAARYAELEAQVRQQGSEREASTRTAEAKQEALDQSRAEVADLDSKLMTALNAGAENPSHEHELADLRAQIVDRDERLEAWDSRFHASVGELRARLQSQDAELAKLREALAADRKAMTAAAGFASVPGSIGARHSDEDVRRLKDVLENGLAMHGVQFLPSSAELIPQALPILEQAADAMHQYPDVSVEIAGHTDSWGTPAENLSLSQERAGAVKEYLINSGIAAWRLIGMGYGDKRPIDSNDTADGRFANRRIEFHVKQ